MTEHWAGWTPGRWWLTTLPELGRCRYCGLDTLDRREVESHEETCVDRPARGSCWDNKSQRSLTPEGPWE